MSLPASLPDDRDVRPWAGAPAEPALAGLPERLPLALWASGDRVWEWDGSGFLLWRCSGPQRRAQVERLDVAQFLDRAHPQDHEGLRQAWAALQNGPGEELDLNFRGRTVHAPARWWRVRGRALQRGDGGQLLRAIGTLRDVTGPQRARQQLRRLAHAFDSSREALVLTDAHWQLVAANRSARALLDAAVLAPGASLQPWLTARGWPPQLVQRQVRLHGLWQAECPVSGPQGEVPVECSVTAVQPDADDAVVGDGQGPGTREAHGYVLALHDLRERLAAQARLQRQATLDEATGLPNRLAAQWHLEPLLGRSQPRAALLRVLVDGVRHVNASWGPQAAEALVVQVAQRLRQALDDGCWLARWGDDEFLLVLSDDADDTALRSVAQLVLAALARPFDVEGRSLTVSVVLGAVRAPQDGAAFGVLMRKAELALQAARQSTTVPLAFYDRRLDDERQRRLMLGSLLRQDTERNAFTWQFQPKVDAAGRCTGGELLMRWHTEAYGEVPPAEFIALAEELGLIGLMGRHAVHAAAQLAAAGAAAGLSLPVAVNLSPRQLATPGIEAMLLHACRRQGLQPAQLELELTESALAGSIDEVAPVLQRLRQAGFVMALDDFGTGYSSLAHLGTLPMDKVKIDRSFVLGLGRDVRAQRLLEGIVQLCRALGLRTVAEGVETPAQHAALAALGVDEFQGYLFARPLPLARWLDLLAAADGQAPQLPGALAALPASLPAAEGDAPVPRVRVLP
ncbi:putative bifunctional diguanylate cyclase/phosphodiesterase [Pseudaquabacterium rugosum]|uniref:EAL domain-containing protein n=1 Tax=Pseudaquabacterium rugosum TaxID=2984194 RepID=A0ABU9B5L9_9BURK